MAGVCPPVVEYDDGFLARAAVEVQALPEGSAIVEMLSDYAVLREQVRSCYYIGFADDQGKGLGVSLTM